VDKSAERHAIRELENEELQRLDSLWMENRIKEYHEMYIKTKNSGCTYKKNGD
jgi:hypothetical protein